MLDTEKLTQENDIYSELSLESILAEYADFDAGLAAEGSTSERSKQIVYEALGETEFSGGLTDDDAALTEDAHEPPPPETPEPYPAEPERAAGRYTRRLRRGIERFGPGAGSSRPPSRRARRSRRASRISPPTTT